MIELETAEELAATGVVAVRTTRDLLVMAGPDAGDYLQGQLSQDVTGMAVGDTTRTLLLQPQGKVDAWGRLHRRADTEFWFDVEAGHGEGAKARLERFKLRVDAEIGLHPVDTVALRGPAAASTSASSGASVALPLAWPGLAGVDLFPADPAGGAPVPVPDGIEEGPTDLLDVLRIVAGLPAMGLELDGDTIPAAARVVDGSVDFTKGCYVGQELVARVDSRGSNTPTRLYHLRFGGPGVVAGAEVLDGDVVVGRVTSAGVSPRAGGVGLGYLKRAVSVPAELSVRLPDGAVTPARAEEPAAA